MNCKALCAQHLRRPHFTCLTCWIRRWWYRREPGLRMVTEPMRFKFEGETVRGFEFSVENKRGVMVLPHRFTTYMLFIKQDSRAMRVKYMLLKPLLSLAEAIARW